MAHSLIRSIAMERYTNEFGIEPWSVYSDGIYAYFETDERARTHLPE